MRARQGKFRVLVVVKRCTEPACRGVANLALLRERGLHMVRISRGCEIFGMATVTIRRGAFEFSTDVAGCTFQSGMRAC